MAVVRLRYSKCRGKGRRKHNIGTTTTANAVIVLIVTHHQWQWGTSDYICRTTWSGDSGLVVFFFGKPRFSLSKMLMFHFRLFPSLSSLFRMLIYKMLICHLLILLSLLTFQFPSLFYHSQTRYSGEAVKS